MFKQGDRIAQLILEVIATAEVEEVNSLDETERGNGGFGSTGISAPSNKRHASGLSTSNQ